MKAVDDLKQTLAQQALRFRSGVIVADSVDRKSLDHVALCLQAYFVDYHSVVASRLLPDARVVPIDPIDILSDLKGIAIAEQASPFALILNLDLALAKLGHDTLARFWHSFAQLEPFSKTAVVVVLPSKAISIQPSGQQLNSWKEWGRIAFAGEMLMTG